MSRCCSISAIRFLASDVQNWRLAKCGYLHEKPRDCICFFGKSEDNFISLCSFCLNANQLFCLLDKIPTVQIVMSLFKAKQLVSSPLPAL